MIKDYKMEEILELNLRRTLKIPHIEITKDKIILTCEYLNNVETVEFDKEEYFKLVKRTGFQKRFRTSSIYIKDLLNLYIEDWNLFLDKNIPFSTQEDQMYYLKRYIFFPYDHIYYDGKISFLNRITRGRKVLTLEDCKDESNKVSYLLIEIRLSISRLNSKLKEYVNSRIDAIYSASKNQLANTDLTKPIKNVGESTIYEELTKLDEQIPILTTNSSFIEEWLAKDHSKREEYLHKFSESYRAHFDKLIDDAREDFLNQAVENTIAESEGRKFIPIEELAKEFDIKIESYYKLILEYCICKKSTFDIIASPNIDYELIIARIESIFSFYGEPNPHSARIEEYKRKLKTAMKNQDELNGLLEEYEQYLLMAINESEKHAFDISINSWKNNDKKTEIYGSDQIFIRISFHIKLYQQCLKRFEEYEIGKNKKNNYENNLKALIAEKELCEKVKQQYEGEYQSILDKISKINSRSYDSMVRVTPEEEYEAAIKSLENLALRVLRDLRQDQLKDSIDYLENGLIVNLVENDPSVATIFAKLEEADYELSKLERYSNVEDLFNHHQINKYFNTDQTKYNEIVRRIISYYRNGENQEEYQSILSLLDSLISETKTICKNEEELITESTTMHP